MNILNECNNSIFENGFIYLNAERIGPRIAMDMNSYDEFNIGSKGEYTNHVIHKADLLKIDIHKNVNVAAVAKFSAQCEAWLNTIIPDVQFEISINDDYNKSKIKYRNAKSSTDYYEPTATGFGITYVLPIIVANRKVFSSYFRLRSSSYCRNA